MKNRFKATIEAFKQNKNAIARKTTVFVGAAAGMVIASVFIDNYRKNGDPNVIPDFSSNPFDRNPFDPNQI